MSAAGERYMAYVRRLPCALCVRLGLARNEPANTPVSSAHHARTGAGAARKNPDEWTMPLCPAHHQYGPDALHVMGRKAWERRFGATEMDLVAETQRRVQELMAMEV